MVNCIHWSIEGSVKTCAAGHYFRPSYGTCERCPHRQARDGKPTLLAKAANATRALVSRGLGNKRVALPIFGMRAVGCHGNPAVGVSPCESRLWNDEDGFHYCDAC